MDKDKFTNLGKAYLQSNACGRWDGASKADAHRMLCELFVSERLNVTLNKAAIISVGTDRLAWLVRGSTLSLTDNLDEEINFPLEVAPNYNKLTPIFVAKFLNLASGWFDDQVGLMSDELLVSTLNEITKNRFRMAFPALESYGFEFVDGVGDGLDPFLTAKSQIDQVVTIKPNEYFGCKFTLDEGLNK